VLLLGLGLGSVRLPSCVQPKMAICRSNGASCI